MNHPTKQSVVRPSIKPGTSDPLLVAVAIWGVIGLLLFLGSSLLMYFQHHFGGWPLVIWIASIILFIWLSGILGEGSHGRSG